MKLRIVCLLAASAALATAACKSSSSASGATADPASGSQAAAVSSAPAASPSAAKPPSAASGPPSPLAIPGATAAALPNMPIPERFALEAKGRPQGIKPTVEDVYKGLTAAGLKIVDERQHLAAPLGARYCVGARAAGATDADTILQISVCECASPDVAKVARDWSTQTMATVIPNRTLYVNGQTLLVVREEKASPDSDAAVAKASSAFAGM